MPSSRRVRIVIIALVVAVFTLLYLSNDSTSKAFYSRTVAALDKKDKSDAEVARKLREAKDDAKAHRPQTPIGGDSGQKPLADDSDGDKPHVDIEVPQNLPTDKAAQMKAPSDNRPSEDKMDSEKSVAGRKTMQKSDAKKTQLEKESSSGASKEAATETATEKNETDGEIRESKEAHEVEQEINSILKRSPIIIFSKSYCPHSKRAKSVFEKYTIVPSPFIVELDQHPLGPRMQDTLEKMTGRRTVPNVLVNGKSIGGGDEIAALDTGTDLIDKVKDMGGKRIMEAKRKADKA